jgi:diguanylate cyclase (GGDEF)-like protein
MTRKKHALSEKLVTAESRRRIAELENAAELRRKERELLLLQKEKQAERLNVLRLQRESEYQKSLHWFLFAALVAACVIMILLFGVLRLRKRLHEQLITRHIHVKELNLQLQDMSMRDALTGLYNRRYLTGLLAELAKRDDAWHRVHMLVVMMDLDHFKNINDLHGHAAGDAVLQYFAELIRKCSRQNDVPVRWGGEEFVLLCAGMNLEQGVELCTRIRQLAHASDFVWQDRKIPLTCSFGMALFPLHPDLPPEWNWSVQMADAALYAAKSAGRDRWVAYGLESVPDRLRRGDFDIQRLLREDAIQVTEMEGEGHDRE